MPKRIFLIIKCNLTEHQHINEKFLAERIFQAFRCKSVLIAKSINLNDISFFIGKLCEDQEKKVNLKEIKTLFHEFKDSSIQFRKGFAPICCHFVHRREFLLFGDFSREEIFQIAENSKQHRKLLSSIPKKERKSYNHGCGMNKDLVKKEKTFFSISLGDLFIVKRFFLGGLGLCLGYFIFDKCVSSFLIIFFYLKKNLISNTEFLESAKSFEDAVYLTPEPRSTPTPGYVALSLFLFTIFILMYQNR